MSTGIGAIGLIVAIVALILMIYKGVHVAIATLIASAIVIVTNGMNIADSFVTTYSTGLGNFFSTYFLMFCLASAYGEVMKITGAAETIANALFKIFGARFAPIATLLVTWILAYGGINAFIVVFAVYPIAMPLFRKANISKNLMPAIFLYGSVVVLVCTPGVIAGLMYALSEGFHVSPLSAATMGIIALIISLIFGVVYLMVRTKMSAKKGEVFEASESDLELIKAHEGKELPPLWSSLAPLILVMVLRVVLMKAGIGTMAASYISIFTSTALLIVLQYKYLKGIAIKTYTDGFLASVNIMLLTGAMMGFAAVVNAAPCFELFINFAKYLSEVANPYISAIISINIFSGITGASMSGATIFAQTLSDTYLSYNIDPSAMFRITSIASMGLDTLPHCPTFLAMATVCGVTAKKSYGHVFWCTVVAPIGLALICVVLALAGIV
jgi:H+/gluconate symporter-like permease